MRNHSLTCFGRVALLAGLTLAIIALDTTAKQGLRGETEGHEFFVDFRWSPDERMFENLGGDRSSLQEVSEMLGGSASGILEYEGEPQPWILVDAIPWVFGSGGSLKLCSSCEMNDLWWNSEKQKFQSKSGWNFSGYSVLEMLESRKGGVYNDAGKEYPWIKLGDYGWIVGSDGLLRYCPECAVSGDPDMDEVWPSPSTSSDMGSKEVWGAVDGKCVVKGEVASASNCKLLYYENMELSGWQECDSVK